MALFHVAIWQMDQIAHSPTKSSAAVKLFWSLHDSLKYSDKKNIPHISRKTILWQIILMHGPSFNLFVFNCVPPKIVSVTFWTVCKALYDVLKLRFKKTLTLLLKEWKRLALGKLPTSHATEKKLILMSKWCQRVPHHPQLSMTLLSESHCDCF